MIQLWVRLENSPMQKYSESNCASRTTCKYSVSSFPPVARSSRSVNRSNLTRGGSFGRHNWINKSGAILQLDVIIIVRYSCFGLPAQAVHAVCSQDKHFCTGDLHISLVPSQWQRRALRLASSLSAVKSTCLYVCPFCKDFCKLPWVSSHSVVTSRASLICVESELCSLRD